MPLIFFDSMVSQQLCLPLAGTITDGLMNDLVYLFVIDAVRVPSFCFALLVKTCCSPD
jgi:hypothetical protein